MRDVKIKYINKDTKPEEIFKDLELEQFTLYEVIVQKTLENPPFKSFLFTGFTNGSYCTIYNNTSAALNMINFHSIVVIKKLTSLRNTEGETKNG
jgi:hypothetical protein